MNASKITALDFFEDLSSPYARKRFFWAFVILIIVSAVIQFFTLYFVNNPFLKDLISSVALQLFSTSFVITFFYIVYLHLIGPNWSVRNVRALRPQDINSKIRSLLTKTNLYVFWGRSGSYFRSQPLRVLDAQSRDGTRNIDIEVLLPDPTDDRLVQSYRQILDSLGEDNSENSLLIQVLATSIACAVADANNRYLSVALYYSKFLPGFRLDLSSVGAILTHDDPSKPALMFDGNSEFHEMFRSTARSEMMVSRKIEWQSSLFDGLKLGTSQVSANQVKAFELHGDCDPQLLAEKVNHYLINETHRYKR
jgi:uncharacterized membrane protein YhaH (DUF805 family)